VSGGKSEDSSEVVIVLGKCAKDVRTA